MPRRSNPGDVTGHLDQLRLFLQNFETELGNDDLRLKVRALIPVFRELRDMGSSLVAKKFATSARDRILYYFQKYPKIIITGEEINIVAGINEWPRRIRELRREFGWSILSGQTIREMVAEGDLPAVIDNQDLTQVEVDDYLLSNLDQDRDAAYRWHTANTIRNKRTSVKDKILEFFQANVGKEVTGEELRYVSKDKTEWARRVRELRTEEGWPVVTKQTGCPDLAVGVYILEFDRQTPPHDRKIPDNIRLRVLERDSYRCTICGWDHSRWSREVPRVLELHHVQPHAKGGENSEENLITLCNVCHDEVHSRR